VFAVGFLGGLGCESQVDAVPAPQSRQLAVEPVELLSPPDQLLRISMALRGTRPAAEDLKAVDTDPALIEAFVDDYLDSEEFGATIRDLHAETLYIRTADGVASAVRLPDLGPLSDRGLGEIHRSLVEAPLKLVEQVVLEDRPYTEILTADWMMSDSVNADVWGLPYDSDGPEWQVSEWGGQRPAAGVLADTALFIRFLRNAGNFNRGRANMVSRAFLCHDFFDRDIVLDLPREDELFAEHAVEEQATCIGCHQAMDPLAGAFWGFRGNILFRDILDNYDFGCDQAVPIEQGLEVVGGNCYPLDSYFPELEDHWQLHEMPPPSYFGTPVSGLGDVAAQIAADPRFSLCTSRRFYSFLNQVPLDEVPFEHAAGLQRGFIDDEFSARSLVRSIVLSEDFLASPYSGSAEGSMLLVRPEQLSRMIEDLTGFRWDYNPDAGRECLDSHFDPEDDSVVFGCWGEAELTTSTAFGLGALAGGTDGYRRTAPSHSISPGRSLLVSRLAEEAAGYVVGKDLSGAPPEHRRLLTEVEASTTEELPVRGQLALLHLRILGESVGVESAEVDESYALFEALLAESSGDTAVAWKGLIAAFLQDTRVLFY